MDKFYFCLYLGFIDKSFSERKSVQRDAEFKEISQKAVNFISTGENNLTQN